LNVTKDGYFLPSNDEELPQAIEHNSKLDAMKQQTQTLPEIVKKLKVPRGYNTTGLKLDNYLDNVEEFYLSQPFFYDKTCMFWLWNKETYRYEHTDETDIMNMIEQELGFGGQTVSNKIKGNYLEAFRRVGRKHIPRDMPKTWIQFKNKIIDIKTNAMYEVDHTYYAVNPIPWNIGTNTETPVMDKLFNEWQGENKKVLYEVLAYCLIQDYPIHTIITMIGSGRNGKSQYQLIIEKLLGSENITSTELDVLIDNRFESAKLYKKLVCSMGETNFGMIQKTSLLKKLCGGDLIGYEFKNKMPFTAHNYAKIIINTNSLPPSSDTTEGFYRRWLIINWSNCFPEGKDIVNTIPDVEYDNLCFKLIPILKDLLERGNFTTQGSIEERKQRYIMASNPISVFIAERCIISDSSYCKAKDLYHSYLTYLNENKRRIVKRKEFNQLLAEEGFQAEHKEKRINDNYENSYWIEGLSLKPNSALSAFSALDSHSTPHAYGTKVESQAEKAERAENNELNEPFGWEMVDLLIFESSTRNVGKETLISCGVLESDIEKWIKEGLFFESPAGFLRKV
jgi:P4 family phage/plasmid primase-like protien